MAVPVACRGILNYVHFDFCTFIISRFEKMSIVFYTFFLNFFIPETLTTASSNIFLMAPSWSGPFVWPLTGWDSCLRSICQAPGRFRRATWQQLFGPCSSTYINTPFRLVCSFCAGIVAPGRRYCVQKKGHTKKRYVPVALPKKWRAVGYMGFYSSI